MRNPKSCGGTRWKRAATGFRIRISELTSLDLGQQPVQVFAGADDHRDHVLVSRRMGLSKRVANEDGLLAAGTLLQKAGKVVETAGVGRAAQEVLVNALHQILLVFGT